MQSISLHGIPYCSNSACELYLWNPDGAANVYVGYYHPETKVITYDKHLHNTLQPHVEAWRKGVQAKKRQKGGHSSVKNYGCPVEAVDSDHDEWWNRGMETGIGGIQTIDL